MGWACPARRAPTGCEGAPPSGAPSPTPTTKPPPYDGGGPVFARRPALEPWPRHEAPGRRLRTFRWPPTVGGAPPTTPRQAGGLVPTVSIIPSLPTPRPEAHA